VQLTWIISILAIIKMAPTCKYRMFDGNLSRFKEGKANFRKGKFVLKTCKDCMVNVTSLAVDDNLLRKFCTLKHASLQRIGAKPHCLESFVLVTSLYLEITQSPIGFECTMPKYNHFLPSIVFTISNIRYSLTRHDSLQPRKRVF
jgi:hypothetical protein